MLRGGKNNGTILCFALRVHYESRRKAPNTRSTSSRVLFRLGCHNTKVGRTVVLPGSSVIGKSLKTKNIGLVCAPSFGSIGPNLAKRTFALCKVRTY